MAYTSTEVADAIKAIEPNARYTVIDGDIDNIQWHSDDITEPSKADIEAKIAEQKTEYTNNQYQRDRALSYPLIKEQLDLLYHDMTAGKGDKTGEWYKAVKEVKDDNPKPSE